MNEQEYDPKCEIPLDEFNRLCDTVEWSMEPVIECVNACGYRDLTYKPNKRAQGVLADGRYVWCWATGKNVKREATP